MKVTFRQLATTIRPKEHIDLLRPLLPGRYAPLQPNGNGLQSVCLTELPEALAEVLLGLVGGEAVSIAQAARAVTPAAADDLETWEGRMERVAHRPSLERMGIELTKPVQVGTFSSGQKKFLDLHRSAVLPQSLRR